MKIVADRYEIGEEVGGGGTATVHRGRDLRLGREVAVKLFRVDVEAELNRVKSELTILASLNHPNLVSLYDAGEEPEAYIVLEFVEGPTLSELIKEGPLPWREAAKLGADLASGLSYSHQAGVVHRDVKPSNVLMGKSGAKLTDFGVAQLEHAEPLTSTGIMVGTAAYLSPEQVRGRRAKPSSDVYSLGLTLVEALSGKRSYPGAGLETAFHRLDHGPEIPENIPPSFADLLRAMTSIEASERPTAKEVEIALDEMLEADDKGDAFTHIFTPPPVQIVPEDATAVLSAPKREEAVVPVENAKRMSPALIGAGAVLLLLMLFGAFHLLTGGRDAPRDDPNEPAVPSQYEEPLDRLEELVQP